MFQMGIFDDEEHYPENGTLEEKAVFSLEQMRRNFWHQKRHFRESREGGERYHAVLLAYGHQHAQQMAKNTESAFQNFLKQAYLTEDGQTTDPKYPTDKMINSELRRIRSLIILNVSQYMMHFKDVVPESVSDWTRDILYFTLFPYVNRYFPKTWQDINLVIPERKLCARTPAELEKYIADQASYYGHSPNTRNYDHAYLVNRIRDGLIEFLLKDLPFNNERLKRSDDLIKKPETEETQAVAEKQMIH